MSKGPLRRLTAFAGLAALVPTSLLLANGSLTPTDAAGRALVTLVLVLAIGRIAERALAGLLAVFERESQAHDPEGDAPRRSDGDRRSEPAPTATRERPAGPTPR